MTFGSFYTSSNTLHRRKSVFFFKSCLAHSSKTEHQFYLAWHSVIIPRILFLLHDCQKLGAQDVAETFQLEGAEYFLNLGCKSYVVCVCAALYDGGLIEIQRLFREQGIFYICTISIEISPKFERNYLIVIGCGKLHGRARAAVSCIDYLRRLCANSFDDCESLVWVLVCCSKVIDLFRSIKSVYKALSSNRYGVFIVRKGAPMFGFYSASECEATQNAHITAWTVCCNSLV